MSNVLILGAGYVGTELYYSSNDTNAFWLKSKNTLDYTDESVLRKFILNKGIDYIINCSGFTGRPNVDEGETKKEDCWELNVKLPLKVSKTCRTLGVEYIHISSGCIFTGYDKEFTETDTPNFGLFNDSSFYSKSKHAFETLNDYGCTIRVRMPFCQELHDRSFITKIYKYNNIINYKNSKTYISDLVRFIETIIDSKKKTTDIGVINFVNPDAQDTAYLVNRMKSYNLNNKQWKFVPIEDINIKAPRSNCVLSIDKLKTMFPYFHIHTEKEAIEHALTGITNTPKIKLS
jgi:dTDP-4-dehydrorhamnose reductase